MSLGFDQGMFFVRVLGGILKAYNFHQQKF